MVSSMKNISIIISLVFVSAITGCNLSGVPYTDIFEESNRPGIEYYAGDVEGDGRDYFLVKPWNFEKQQNAERLYPLLIYLHGSQQVKYIQNLYYMGMGYYSWDNNQQNMTAEYQKGIADEFRKKYPCFMYVPQGMGTGAQAGTQGWNYNAIIAKIEELKSLYRVDPDRIYLHGFSMGGGGSLTLAKKYYDYNRQLFAGIILLSGGGSLSGYDQVVSKTAIWAITCNTDLSYATSVYNYLKGHALNNGAVETYIDAYNMVPSHPGHQWILERAGWDCTRMTHFTEASHFTTEFPFRDPEVMEWLFFQDISYR